MWAFENFSDYEIIDASKGEKLERWGDIVLIRPDPQVIWDTERKHPLWYKADARYIRSQTGGGYWNTDKLPNEWTVKYKELIFKLKPMSFKHTGLFPEQAVNWDFYIKKITQAKRPIKVLNLFAYTGAATLACAYANASVCHVDASKGMVSWAKENLEVNGLKNAPVRYIVDDCVKFIKREIRRGNKYDAIIMDPPTYGRGPGGEMWRIENDLYELVKLSMDVLSDEPLFYVINSYTAGLAPSVMDYLLSVTMKKKFSGTVESDELGILVKETGCYLPCGATSRWQA